MKTTSFTISDNAAKRIAKVLAEEKNPAAKLRVSVLGGDCSGFQYNLDVDDKVEEGDIVIRQGDAVIAIDPVSMDLLKGSTLNFESSMAGASFKISNPNATASCGCGNSFAV